MTSIKKINKYIPGLILVLIISFISIFLKNTLKSYIQIDELTIAIIIGIIYNNTISTLKKFKEGIYFSLEKLLKAGIILLGFKLNFNAILNLGPKILFMIIAFVFILLASSIVLGKAFKVNKKLAALIGVGSSICGASAIVAVSPFISAEEDDAIIAVSVVNFLGAIGVLAYSFIALSHFDFTPIQYGVWCGLSLHSVANSLAAAFALGDVSGEFGTFVKMARVLMIIPVTILLGLIFNKNSNTKKIKFPTYVLLFIISGFINIMGFIPLPIIRILTETSSLFILMAMTAMGLSVHFKSIINKGIAALMLGTLLFAVFSSASLYIIIKIL